MSDTNKATPIEAYGVDLLDNRGRLLAQVIGDSHYTLQDRYDITEMFEKAVNSYNPDRDKLARELAEMLEVKCDDLDDGTLEHLGLKHILDKARQLLKLYGEEK